MISKNKQRITVTLDKNVLRYIRYKAEQVKLTVSEYVNSVFKYGDVLYGSKKFVYSLLDEKVKNFYNNKNIKVENLSFIYHINSDSFTFSFTDSTGEAHTGKVTLEGVFIDE